MAEEAYRNGMTARRLDDGRWAVQLAGDPTTAGYVAEEGDRFLWSLARIDESGDEATLGDAMDAIAEAD